MEKKSLFEQLTARKVILYMLGFLLFLSNLFMLSIMPGLLYPLRAIMSIVGPPLVIATIFFYLFNPVITWLQKRGIARSMGVLILFLAILGIIVISVLYVFPIIQHQVESIIVVLPRYFNELIGIIDPLIQTSDFREMYQQIQNSNIVQTITEQGTNVLNATLSGVGSFVNIITQAVFIIFTVPFILYFLLVSPEKVPNNIIRVVPTRWRQSISSFLTSVHEQLSIYVRGQLMVAFFVGLSFLVGFAIIGLDFYIVLAIIGGVLNLVPYLGSITATLLALIIGFFQAPIMVVYVLIVISLESLVENRIIQPFILGNQLNIHPITILFIMLTAGKMMGVMGLLLGIPIYAILKIMFHMILDYIREHTELYPAEERPSNRSEKVLIDTTSEEK